MYVSANVRHVFILIFPFKIVYKQYSYHGVSYTIYFDTVILIHFIQQNTLRNGVQRNVKYKITYYLYATVAINPRLLISSVHTNFNIHAIDF